MYNVCERLQVSRAKTDVGKYMRQENVVNGIKEKNVEGKRQTRCFLCEN